MNFLIILGAKYLYLLIILIFISYFLFFSKIKRKEVLLLTIFAGITALLIAKVAGSLYNNPRPFVVDHFTPLIAHSPSNGFPSDHTLLSMTLAAITYVYNRKLGIGLAVLAVLVGLCRVAAGVHHLIDILGAIVIALAAVYLARFLLKLVIKKVKIYS